MDTEFWLERWENDQIGFHQPGVNACLQRYWPQLALEKGSRVLVPLCGKSLDMLWLVEQGHRVVGVELSRLAAEAFYRENGMRPEVQETAQGNRYVHENIEIVCADFFCLAAKDIGQVDAFYDRAALIALTPAQRPDYANCLVQLLGSQAPGLLITLDYDPSEMSGPPFAVSRGEVYHLFENRCSLEDLLHNDVLDENPRFRDRGLTALSEHAYHLRRK